MKNFLFGLTPVLAAASIAAMSATPLAAQTIRLDELPIFPEMEFSEPLPATVDDRIVVMSEDLIEIIHALGQQDRIVAQIETASLPTPDPVEETISNRPSVEGLAALEPTLVIGSHFRFSQPILEEIVPLGLNGVFVDARLPAPEKIRNMGELLGVQTQAEDLAAQIEADYAQLPEPPADEDKLRVIQFSARGGSGRVTGSGFDTPANALIELAGGLNVGAEAGLDRYQSITPEGVVSMQPEAIIISAAEIEALGGIDGLWDTIPGLSLTPAGMNRKLIVVHDLHIRNNATGSGILALALADAFAELNQ